MYKDTALWMRTDFAEIVASPVEKAQAYSCALQKTNSFVRTQRCSRETALLGHSSVCRRETAV